MLRILTSILLILLALATWPFVEHSVWRSWGALMGDADALGRLFHAESMIANVAIFAHMTLGAIITITVPLQILPVIRNRVPRLHRVSGYVLATTATLTAIGGLTYIALKGTIGGSWMSFWFAVYGALMILAAAQTVYYALDKDMTRHRQWALRLMVLAVGSWLYRVHYGLWVSFVGKIGIERDFTGPFDQVQVWAFFLPYLALLQLWFVVENRRARRPVRSQTG